MSFIFEIQLKAGQIPLQGFYHRLLIILWGVQYSSGCLILLSVDLAFAYLMPTVISFFLSLQVTGVAEHLAGTQESKVFPE